jgi:hypothetical protein
MEDRPLKFLWKSAVFERSACRDTALAVLLNFITMALSRVFCDGTMRGLVPVESTVFFHHFYRSLDVDKYGNTHGAADPCAKARITG